jgi:hypothetical protein
MKKIFLTLTLIASFIATAQVKIGDNPTEIDANSLLELESDNQGLLYPRVALESTTSYAPLNSTLPNVKQRGMTVYNTATVSDVTPGLYVNDGFNWVKVTPKTLYTDNAAITSARTVTLNNNDLTFTAGVGGTGKTVVASTFKTGGAVYGNGRTVSRLLTSDWTATDYAVILTIGGLTINLPDASLPENDGRIIFVANDASTNSTYGGTVDKFKPVNVTTITTARAQQIISVGGLWHLISGIKN